MDKLKFKKELYSKTALIKAAYNYTDVAYVHLDADNDYYYVTLEAKDNNHIDNQDFTNEMLAQSVRHEVFQQTKEIRKLLLARALATSVITNESDDVESTDEEKEIFDEDEILKDWFASNDNAEC